MPIYMPMYICIPICMFTYMSIYVYTYVFFCTCNPHAHAHTHTHVQSLIHPHTNAHIHAGITTRNNSAMGRGRIVVANNLLFWNGFAGFRADNTHNLYIVGVYACCSVLKYAMFWSGVWERPCQYSN